MFRAEIAIHFRADFPAQRFTQTFTYQAVEQAVDQPFIYQAVDQAADQLLNVDMYLKIDINCFVRIIETEFACFALRSQSISQLIFLHNAICKPLSSI